MKKKIIFSLALFLAIFSFTGANAAERPVKDSAIIFIYRPGQFSGAGANWAIYVDDKKICKLSNNKYLFVVVPAGKHTISSRIGGVGMFKKNTELEIEVEEGGDYYVACNIKSSITRTRLE
ncbi:MAG TPA: DUF2846 domain-containing protein, partial [Chitinophagaceae bacterium]|nr:DUF2846 domain-containing protein [Chitinophagaceae bacterium]